MMAIKSKPPAATGGDNWEEKAQVFELSDCTTQTAQPSTAFDALLIQAVRRMIFDPGNYDRHFRIWLSLSALVNRWPWPGVGR